MRWRRSAPGARSTWRASRRAGRSTRRSGRRRAPEELEAQQLSEAGDRLAMSGEAERMPGHRLVAGDDRLAEDRLELLDHRDGAQAGAGQEDALDVRRVERLRRGDDAGRGDRGDVGVPVLVECAESGDVETARGEILMHPA